MSSLDQVSDIDRIGFGQKKKTATLSNTSSEATSTTSRISSVTSKTTVSNGNGDTTPRKSSSALRDQISKAKAAKRAAAAKNTTINTISQDDEVPVIASGTFDFGLPSNPFNQGENDNGAKGLLRKRIDAARTDGRLNIAGMGFKEIPDEVMNMYNLDVVGANGGSWAESVDLTRLIAADNELEVIQDDIFPDLDPRDSMNDEDGKGNQFGGLETLDLHGNMLKALPVGLRRLELLTTVNLWQSVAGKEIREYAYGRSQACSEVKDGSIHRNIVN
ncbi:putative Leucine-rich repeat-containing protein 40 [Glarea lozoyensis 74030]|uniref:Putative Leucine-rich repeat-containing protein 40 n=1 Tax=Glarea lozoyensis (strain ATCC 74030 / MF5533) TaxID=1104152 RepID=H0EGC9_GLAL7|nr:putative Leucine-rich repeat-containing protein 40 [Glarea lozoyensis 74030]